MKAGFLAGSSSKGSFTENGVATTSRPSKHGKVKFDDEPEARPSAHGSGGGQPTGDADTTEGSTATQHHKGNTTAAPVLSPEDWKQNFDKCLDLLKGPGDEQRCANLMGLPVHHQTLTQIIIARNPSESCPPTLVHQAPSPSGMDG